MANYLKVAKRQQVIALLQLGWSFRRIERETGVRRETISRYAEGEASKAAKVFPGSEGSEAPETGTCGANPAKAFPGSGSNPAKVFPGSRRRSRSAAAGYESQIRKKLNEGLSVQRIYQDLVEEVNRPGFSGELVS